MSAQILVGNKLFAELKKVMNFPEHATWLELRIACDEIVTARCGFAVEVSHPDKAIAHVSEVLGEYVLFAKGEAPQPKPALEARK